MRKDCSDYTFRKETYKKVPQDLIDFSYYVADCGHSILAIPVCLMDEAKQYGDLYEYEVPLPVQYVLDKGYFFSDDKDHVFCEVKYDDMMGAILPDEYLDEF